MRCLMANSSVHSWWWKIIITRNTPALASDISFWCPDTESHLVCGMSVSTPPHTHTHTHSCRQDSAGLCNGQSGNTDNNQELREIDRNISPPCIALCCIKSCELRICRCEYYWYLLRWSDNVQELAGDHHQCQISARSSLGKPASLPQSHCETKIFC